MHEPTDELFLGVIHPDAALFEDYFDVDKAAKEHCNYREKLTEAGAKVLTVREILLQGTLDKNGEPIEGNKLDELRSFASQFLTYNTSGIADPETKQEQLAYKEEIIRKANPKDLVRIILLRPEIILVETDSNTGLAATYTQRPIMNIFFMRDQMIVTAAGIVIGRLNSPQRQAERRIIEFCLNKIGMSPIHKIDGEGAYLEGGDFLPFVDSAFIGCGLRTTKPAIEQLMKKNLLGWDKLIVVKDEWQEQEQMHLDTFFNVIDKDLATLDAKRYEAKKGDSRYLTIDIYERENSKSEYRKTISNRGFVDYMENELNVKIIPISEKDQSTYANNFLSVGPRHIMAVAGQSKDLEKILEENRVNVIWVRLDNLVKGYGAAHCMTQIIDEPDVLAKK